MLIEGGKTRRGDSTRSEEHTSELQSQSNLVCRLLLEKKKYLCSGACFFLIYTRLGPRGVQISLPRPDALRIAAPRLEYPFIHYLVDSFAQCRLVKSAH